MLKRFIARFIALNLIVMTGFVPMAQAGLVGTQSALQQQQAQDNRSKLNQIINRADLATLLEDAGVAQSDVQQRVNALSDQEVASLVQQFEEVPAGSGIVGLAVVVFFVLLATDILGYTDIFPFVVKK